MVQWIIENRYGLVAGCFFATVAAIIALSCYNILRKWERRWQMEVMESTVEVGSRMYRFWLVIEKIAYRLFLVSFALYLFSIFVVLADMPEGRVISSHALEYFAAMFVTLSIASYATWRMYLHRQLALREIRRNASMDNRRG